MSWEKSPGCCQKVVEEARVSKMPPRETAKKAPVLVWKTRQVASLAIQAAPAGDTFTPLFPSRPHLYTLIKNQILSFKYSAGSFSWER